MNTATAPNAFVSQKRRRNEIFWVVASVSSAGLLSDRLSVGSPYSPVGVVPVTTPPPVEVNAAARADGRHPFRASFIVEVLRRPGEPGRFRSGMFVELLACNGLRGSMERLGHAVTMRRWNRSSRCCNAMSSTVAAGAAVGNYGRRPSGGSRRPTTAAPATRSRSTEVLHTITTGR